MSKKKYEKLTKKKNNNMKTINNKEKREKNANDICY